MILASALALGATSSIAATCDVGTCNVAGLDGQALSTGAYFQVTSIVNPGSGEFNFVANFLNDSVGNADGAVSVLQFSPSAFGTILDLTLTVYGPPSVATQTFAITDEFGAAINPIGNDVTALLNLVAAPGEVILFELQGNAVPGVGGITPAMDIAITTSAVPLPAAAWLFGSALLGLAGVARRKRA